MDTFQNLFHYVDLFFLLNDGNDTTHQETNNLKKLHCGYAVCETKDKMIVFLDNTLRLLIYLPHS